MSTSKFLVFFFSLIINYLSAQELSGIIKDEEDQVVSYANVALYAQADSSLYKVELTDENGKFSFKNVKNGAYYINATYIGYADLIVSDIIFSDLLDLGELTMNSGSVQLETAVVKARRALIEVKPDRTVFNVEGTINSAGDNALGLLRKAPGVLLDNNDNITVLGRNGVLVYLDGKRLPMAGEELRNYLNSIPAEQIDKIDIITNPGAKYEAEGNAGIIDIRLKKDKNLGSNGTISANISDGIVTRSGASLAGNFRSKKLNTFGTLGYNFNKNYNKMEFLDNQNGLVLERFSEQINENDGYNYRWGTDFYLGKNKIIGFLFTGFEYVGEENAESSDALSSFNSTGIDSILIAGNSTDISRNNNTVNVNYRANNGKSSFSIDLDYGAYERDASTLQPNTYFTNDLLTELTVADVTYDTPVTIDIYTAKADYESDFAGGKLGFGAKYSQVITDNTFLFSDIVNGAAIQNNQRSNQFEYDEKVYAGYANYARSLSKKVNLNAGVRLEQTDATGELTAFDPTLSEPPVEQDYLSVFPTVGISYQAAPMHAWSVNYGRRINRPDYNVLNPFRAQLSELSFSKGNPFLLPEIVNNYEIGYTWQYRYNFKIAYSRTEDQITRLIGPDDSDPRAGFINWDNLSTQHIYSFNASLPIQFSDKLNSYFNLGINYKNNQADYGDGAIVDIQQWGYNIYQQHTYTLPKGYIAEISGWYSGPGIWGGVFRYDDSYSLNLGLQKRFLNEQLNVKLSVQDVFLQAFWSGGSEFDGLISMGRGEWDSRRVSVAVSYNFGNQNVKGSKRKAGLEDEVKRTGGE